MKAFFEKFKISMALDRDRQLATQIQPDAERSREESLRSLDYRLRESRAACAVPSGLHGRVMRAVRTSTTGSERGPLVALWPRFAAAASLLMIGVGVIWSLNRPEVISSTEAPPSLAAAMEQGHVLTQSAPAAMLSPLSGELDLLNGDIQNAVKFIVASVP